VRVDWRTLASDTLQAAAVVLGASVLIGAIESVGQISNIANLYVIAIAVLAARRGIYAALVASVLAFLAYDWLFVQPVHEFTASDPSEYIALLTLLVTSIVIGQLLAVARDRANQAQSLQRQTQLLYDVSHAALSSARLSSIYPLALWRLNETLGLSGSRLLLRDGERFQQVAGSGVVEGDGPTWLSRLNSATLLVAVWQRPDHGVRLVRELEVVDRDLSAPEDGLLCQLYVPLRIDGRVAGIVVVRERTPSRRIGVEELRLLLAYANQLAIAVERQAAAEQHARAQALEESDRLKSALISSVSHELKTPLAAIKVSATTLLDDTTDTSADVRRELMESINRETDRLTRLVSNLLDISRLEAGALRPQLEEVSIADVVADVLDRMQPLLEQRRVTVDIPDAVPATPLDFVQISQVLTNLLDNALRYSPPEAAISISAGVVRGQLRVTVFNEGSQIPPADLDRLFDKFYRVDQGAGGVGLGLSIARGIVEAHGGRIWAENVGRRGVAFVFTLPSPPPGRAAEEEAAPSPVGLTRA
jgi:two-component system, OmpR family, sensor histidine kinase KdpD